MEIHPTGAALGADVVGVDLAACASQPACRERITAAWRAHLVLRFRDQPLEDDALLAFSRCFGELDPAPISPYGNKPYLPEHPQLGVISNIVEDGVPRGSLGSGEAIWHTDMSYKETPPKGCVLYALEVPGSGGDTSFANMYLAYEQLPDDLKRAIAGRSAKHDSSVNSAGQVRHGHRADYDNPAEIPGAVHPLVRRHPESGRPALFLGRRRNAHVIGLDRAESDALLDALWEQATRPELVWTQHWRVGDVIMWDNRCTLHRREAFDPEARRMMHRAQIRDEHAVEAAA